MSRITSALVRPKKVTGFETSDNQRFEDGKAAERHEASLQLGQRTKQFIEVLGITIPEGVDIHQLAAKASVAGEYLDVLVKAHKGYAPALAKTQVKTTKLTTVAAKSPAAGAPAEMSLNAARALVKKYKGKSGKKPNAYATALEIIEAAKTQKASAPAKAAPAKKAPAAKKPAAKKAPVELTLEAAKAMVKQFKGKSGKKPNAYPAALAMVEAAAGPSAAPAKKAAPKPAPVAPSAPAPTAPPPTVSSSAPPAPPAGGAPVAPPPPPPPPPLT